MDYVKRLGCVLIYFGLLPIKFLTSLMAYLIANIEFRLIGLTVWLVKKIDIGSLTEGTIDALNSNVKQVEKTRQYILELKREL